jgi:bifunctional DNA-binding transcriptional regulator/antitoxin component of YhaV-PrlF toxin-antitoxin module
VAKVTSKLQVTIPKAIAKQYSIVPGDDLLWVAAGEAVQVLPAKGLPKPMDTAWRLSLFDAASKRVKVRERQEASPRGKGRRRAGEAQSQTNRGWTREELYERGGSR